METSLDEKVLLEDRDDASRDGDMWADYARGNNMFVHNAESVSRRLKEVRRKLFSNEEKMQVEILDVVQSKF
jgi:hypothetical protein